MSPVRAEFLSRKVSAEGLRKIQKVRETLTSALDEIESLIPQGGRELALVKTNMETASFYAVKAISSFHEEG